MKNPFTFSKLRLASVPWYIGLSLIGFIALENSCSCSTNHDIDNTPSNPFLEFSKLSYDRSNKRLVVIIKNTGKKIAKDLSLRCTNISKNEASRTGILFNNALIATMHVKDLSPGTSTEELYFAVDFQAAKEAWVQMEIICGQQQAKPVTIPVNHFPIDLSPKGPIILIAKQGEEKDFKWKLVPDQNEKSIDFTKFQLMVWKEQGKDMLVSIEGIGTILDQSIDQRIISGVDLEKLARQQESFVKVKNNSNNNLNQICFILSDHNGENIANILIALVSEIKKSLLPAVVHGNLNFVKQAIAEGADMNTKNIDHKSVLHLATQDCHQKIVRILLENRANVHAIDNDGNTALHVAASKGHQAIVRLLLEHNVNKNIKNNQGETAADLAQGQEMKDLINNWGK